MKRSLSIIFLLFFFLLPFACSKKPFHIASVNNNVCKRLTGEVVLYCIFVDTRYTQPWSAYDINSTLDSIHYAMEWLENKASENGIPLTITVQYHQNNNVIPISQDFPRKTLSGTLLPVIPAGIRLLDGWSNRIARNAGKAFAQDTASIIKTKNKLSDRERLIARLRDMNGTDNVALIYFHNNYYKEEMSVAIHCDSHTETEYAIVSFKQPSVIAHELLHLFGAWDLYINPFERKWKNQRRKKMAMKEFPDEIMAFAYRDIDKLNISPLTQYLIGWRPELDDKYKSMFFGKRKNLLKYHVCK